MAASIAWLSVIVKRGATVVVLSKIVKCNWEDTFGEVFEKAAPHLQTLTFYQIKIAKKDQFVTTQEVSIDAPVSVCEQFACKYISFATCLLRALMELVLELVLVACIGH